MVDHRPRWQQRLWEAWFNKTPLPSASGIALNILAMVYGVMLRFRSKPPRLVQGKPLIIVVGNILVGGAGKTPIVAALAKALRERGKQVGLISRGYGRQSRGTEAYDVDSPSNDAHDAIRLARSLGDEPVWLATTTRCPIVVDQRRGRALAALLKKYPDLDVVLADDGLEHQGLPRHFEIVVFDDRAVGNGRLLPAGPLRAPLRRLARADAIIQTKPDCGFLVNYLKTAESRMPPLFESALHIQGFRQTSTGRLLTIEYSAQHFRKHSIQAFAGIAHPAKFFSVLNELGMAIETLSLPDHFAYPEGFLETLQGSILLTTGKDAVKLPHDDPRLWTLEIELQLPVAIVDLIEERFET
ncbi:MAG: tetraacyldisaccharide 4'-kinase [Burkholderiaceae bacterium]|jgi:tetraacyldisaccharide 4'-kinase